MAGLLSPRRSASPQHSGGAATNPHPLDVESIQRTVIDTSAVTGATQHPFFGQAPDELPPKSPIRSGGVSPSLPALQEQVLQMQETMEMQRDHYDTLKKAMDAKDAEIVRLRKQLQKETTNRLSRPSPHRQKSSGCEACSATPITATSGTTTPTFSRNTSPVSRTSSADRKQLYPSQDGASGRRREVAKQAHISHRMSGAGVRSRSTTPKGRTCESQVGEESVKVVQTEPMPQKPNVMSTQTSPPPPQTTERSTQPSQPMCDVLDEVRRSVAPLPSHTNAALCTILREILVVTLQEDVSVADKWSKDHVARRTFAIAEEDKQLHQLVNTVMSSVVSLKQRLAMTSAQVAETEALLMEQQTGHLMSRPALSPGYMARSAPGSTTAASARRVAPLSPSKVGSTEPPSPSPAATSNKTKPKPMNRSVESVSNQSAVGQNTTMNTAVPMPQWPITPVATPNASTDEVQTPAGGHKALTPAELGIPPLPGYGI